MVYRSWHLALLLLAVVSKCVSTVVAESAGYHLRIHMFESGDADVALSDNSASVDSDGDDDSEEPDADDGPDGVGDGFDIDWTNWAWSNDVTPDVWGDSIGPFGQCGGTGYEGNETCILDWVCVPLADTFSECLPTNWVPVTDGSGTNTRTPVTTSPASTKDPSSTGSGAHSSPPPATKKPVAPNKDDFGAGSSPSDSSDSSSSGSDEPEPDSPSPKPTTATPPATTPPSGPTPSPKPTKTPKPTKIPKPTKTPKPTITQAANPPKPHDVFQFDTVPSWLQCGGRDFNYFQYTSGTFPDGDATKLRCWDGYQCDVINEWFFQCVPIHDPDSAALWSQCGGEFHKGKTNCIAGSYCKFANQWYSQCVPTNDR